MMNYTQAKEMADQFTVTKLFTKVEVEHFGFLSAYTPEAMAAEKWLVRLWSVNAKAGNRNLTTVGDYETDPKRIALIAKVAAKKATKRDQAAYDRIKAEKTVNAE